MDEADELRKEVKELKAEVERLQGILDDVFTIALRQAQDNLTKGSE